MTTDLVHDKHHRQRGRSHIVLLVGNCQELQLPAAAGPLDPDSPMAIGLSLGCAAYI